MVTAFTLDLQRLYNMCKLTMFGSGKPLFNLRPLGQKSTYRFLKDGLAAELLRKCVRVV